MSFIQKSDRATDTGRDFISQVINKWGAKYGCNICNDCNSHMEKIPLNVTSNNHQSMSFFRPAYKRTDVLGFTRGFREGFKKLIA